MSKPSAIGQRLTRVDAIEKVTGRALYAGDLRLPGMLVGRILRSDRPHARIVGIDTSEAERVPGVKAAVTAKDAPDVAYGLVIADQFLLAKDKVRYVGDPVAAVAATDSFAADEALRRIKVTYEDLPAVFDPMEAIKPGAPILHENFKSYGQGLFGGLPSGEGNVCGKTEKVVGDPAKAFAEADFVFEDTFTTQIQHQCYVEPHSSVAKVDADGKVTVWTSTQAMFFVRNGLAKIFSLPLTKVKVVPMTLGGGFGAKWFPFTEPVAVVLAQKTGRPVQVVFSRQEEFEAASPRHATHIRIKSGVMKDGTIVAREVSAVVDAGAYLDCGAGITGGVAAGGCGPYRIPNAKLEAIAVYTNKTFMGAHRAPAQPQICFAIESHTDIMARKLGLDPLEFRLKNGLQPGDVGYGGEKLKRSVFPVLLKKAAKEIGWGKKKLPNVGRGIAIGQWPVGGTSSGAIVKANDDGTFVVITGAVDMAGTNTGFAQIAAEALGVPAERVSVTTADSDTALHAPGSGGSVVTYNVGKAVREAAEDLLKKILRAGAKKLEVKRRDVGFDGKEVFLKADREKKIPLAALASAAGGLVGQVVTQAPPPQLVLAAQAAQVEVDTETGKVTLLKIAAAQDVGRALNPMAVEGQIQGGVSHGIGMALTEEMVVKDGRVKNPTFTDYHVPTACDHPRIVPIIVENKSAFGPFGAKGIGEPPCVPTAAAIANAVCDAVGVRIPDLPLTPEKVLRSLRQKGGPGVLG